MNKVSLHPEAETEYQNAFDWYFDRSPQAAERFEAAFQNAIELIRAQPLLCPLLDAIHRHILLNRYPFSLVYRVHEDEIRIIAVAHTRRRPGYWVSRN